MLLSACLKRADMFNDQMQYLFSHVYPLFLCVLIQVSCILTFHNVVKSSVPQNPFM